MSADPKVTIESTYRNPIPVSDLNTFVRTVKATLQDGQVSVHKDPETGHPTDPGGTITITATGKPKQYRQEGTTR